MGKEWKLGNDWYSRGQELNRTFHEGHVTGLSKNCPRHGNSGMY